jgi:hypothetical protein
VDSTGGRDAELRVLRTRLRETTDQLDRAQIDADTFARAAGAHSASARGRDPTRRRARGEHPAGRTDRVVDDEEYGWLMREATGIGDPDEDAATV